MRDDVPLQKKLGRKKIGSCTKTTFLQSKIFEIPGLPVIN